MANPLSSLISTLQDIFSSLLHFLQAIIGTIQNFFASIIELAGGLVNFVLSNIVLIGVLVAAYVGYTAYAQKRQPGGITKKRS